MTSVVYDYCPKVLVLRYYLFLNNTLGLIMIIQLTVIAGQHDGFVGIVSLSQIQGPFIYSESLGYCAGCPDMDWHYFLGVFLHHP